MAIFQSRILSMKSRVDVIVLDTPATAAPDLPANRTTGSHERSWVVARSQNAPEWKKALAGYASTHLIEPQQMIQIGSGTTLNSLMDAIVARQVKDLQILTTNLQVLTKGRTVQNALGAMNIIFTGGTLNSSLDCTSGPYAAEGVASERYCPHAVFFGAVGVSFTQGLGISYAFEDEESTQVAYATRPTSRRVLLFDHTKLGQTFGKKARLGGQTLSIQAMLKDAQECLFVTTYPEADADVRATIEREEAALKKLLAPLVQDPDFDGRDFVFRLVTKDGNVFQDKSLSGLRQNRW
jgi:hypothetical protein